jgi:tetratricopeptide (TPR) repeat protein
VLDEIAELLPQMDRLPSVVSPGDSILPWTVRESILQAGHVSAATLEHCQQALDFTTAIVASQKARGAHPLDLARMQFNDYGVLITLDRLAEARKVLEHCQQVYENYGETAELAAVMGARGELEDSLGNLAEAVRFAQAAIRYAYIRADPESASIGHHNLAMALDKTGTDTAAQRAHLLSAALICLLAGMRYEFGRTRHFLARELRADADTTGLPTTLDEVISAAEQTDGVHLRQLLDSISPDREAVAAALGNILRSTAPTGSDLPRGIRTRHVRGRLNASLRLIDTAVAAGFGNPNAAARFRSMLDEMAENRDQANLGAVLRSIVDGQYTTSLQDGLDPVATAIAADVLRQLTVMPPDPS